MGASEWGAPISVVVEFSTGRSAKLRKNLPFQDLIRSGAWDDELVDAFQSVQGSSTDADIDPKTVIRLTDAIVCGMFVEPRVSLDGAEGTVPISVLEQAEIDETVEKAFGGAEQATFPGVGDGAAGGGDGEVLGSDAVVADGVAGVA